MIRGANGAGECYLENMALTVNKILGEALMLPPASRASLAEKIVESIEADIEPEIERAHLDEVKRRREDVRSGKVRLIPGDEAMRRARRLLHK